jgi:hypothetical protein
MKPFDLEKALKGAPVITRDGREVTQLCLFDVGDDKYPVYGVIRDKKAGDYISCFTKQGKQYADRESTADLSMKTVKKTGYVLAQHIIQAPCVVDDWIKVEYEE